MWVSTLDLSTRRLLLTKLLSLIYPSIYYSPYAHLRVANVPRPALPAANWVRVRNHLAGICDDDLKLVHAESDPRVSLAALPGYKHIYPGREVVGEVIEIGVGVQRLCVGDRVVLQYHANCISSEIQPVCQACANGNYTLCQAGQLPGPHPIGGGWSEEMLLHEQQLYHLPAGLSDEQAVMLEPTARALHTVLRYLPQPHEKILIVGAGTIGLLIVQILHALVPTAGMSILAHHQFQAERALHFGASHIVPPNDPYASVECATHSKLYKGLVNNCALLGGYDVIYDTIGQGASLHHALRWLRPRGTLVLVGVSLHKMHIDLTPLWHQEIRLLGSLAHGSETWSSQSSGKSEAQIATFSLAVELMEQRRIQPEQLITHRIALNDYKHALQIARDKKHHQSIKVLFDYSLLPALTVPNARATVHFPQLIETKEVVERSVPLV
jgi:threonine dehydrogenase-like Zn-dependent dehydrogenase